MTHTTTDAAEARARLDKLDTRDVHTGYDEGGNFVYEDYVRLADVRELLATAEAASGAVATAATTTEDQLRRIQLLADVELHLKSCRIFLTSREKMHPCGIELHDELLANVTAAIEQEGRNG